MSNITINETVEVALNGTIGQTKNAGQQLIQSGSINEFLNNGKEFVVSAISLLKSITAWISEMMGYPVSDFTKFGITFPVDIALLGASVYAGFKIMKWLKSGAISIFSWLFWTVAVYVTIMLI